MAEPTGAPLASRSTCTPARPGSPGPCAPSALTSCQTRSPTVATSSVELDRALPPARVLADEEAITGAPDEENVSDAGGADTLPAEGEGDSATTAPPPAGPTGASGGAGVGA